MSNPMQAILDVVAPYMDRVLGPSDRAADWSNTAVVDPRFAEGRKDAARHTEWMADTASKLESMAKYGLVALPEGVADHLARGMGGVGAMGIGAGIEALGLGKAAWNAGNQALDGKFARAGATMSEAWDSTKMDLNNNMAGAMTYSQIKDIEQRRAAILDAVNRSELQRRPTLGLDGPLTGQLVRRR